MRQPDFMSPGSLSQHPISEVYSAGHLSLRSFLVFAGWRGQTGNIDASGLHTVSFAASLSCDVFVCLQHDAEPMSPPVSSSMARSQSGPPDSPGYEPRAHHMLSCTAYAVSRADYEREAAAEAAAHSDSGELGLGGAPRQSMSPKTEVPSLPRIGSRERALQLKPYRNFCATNMLDWSGVVDAHPGQTILAFLLIRHACSVQ